MRRHQEAGALAEHVRTVAGQQGMKQIHCLLPALGS